MCEYGEGASHSYLPFLNKLIKFNKKISFVGVFLLRLRNGPTNTDNADFIFGSLQLDHVETEEFLFCWSHSELKLYYVLLTLFNK